MTMTNTYDSTKLWRLNVTFNF